MQRNPTHIARAYFFDLEITRAGEGYLASCKASNRQAEHWFSSPFLPEDVEALWECFGRVPRKRRGSETPKKLVEDFGQRLFQAVFQQDIFSCFSECRTEARQQDDVPLLIRLDLRGAAELADLPWEYLYQEKAEHRFLALSEVTPIVRRLAGPNKPRPLAVEPPLRILFASSAPEDYQRIDTEGEWRAVSEALQPAIAAGRVDLRRLEETNPASLQDEFLSEEYHAVHFVGHGLFCDREQRGKLILKDGEDSRLASNDELGTILHNERTLRFAFFNACEGARSARFNVFSGTAQTAVRCGIPAVIASQAVIGDGTAIELARYFYSNLARGLAIDECLTHARVMISTNVRSLEWGLPVLFLQSEDRHLFTRPFEASAPPTATEIPTQAPGKREDEGAHRATPATSRVDFVAQENDIEATETTGNAGDREDNAEGREDSTETPEDSTTSRIEVAETELGQARLHYRLLSFQRMASGGEIDPGPLSRIEYQRFLESHPSHRRHCPAHWTGGHFAPQTADLPVTGLRAADVQAFCEWLASFDGKNAANYRLPTPEEHRQVPLIALADSTRLERPLAVWCQDGRKHLLVGNEETLDAQHLARLMTIARGHLRRSLVLGVHRHPGLSADLSFPPDPSRDRVLEKALVWAIEEVSPLQTLTFSLDPAAQLEKRLTLRRPQAKLLAAELGRARAVSRNLRRLAKAARIFHLEELSKQDLESCRDRIAKLLSQANHQDRPLALERSAELLRHIRHDLRRVSMLDELIDSFEQGTLTQKSTAVDDRLDIARLAVLFVAQQLSEEIPALPLLEPAAPDNQVEVDRMLRIFWSLALLDLRLRGTYPAYEGLRLVRDSHLRTGRVR